MSDVTADSDETPLPASEDAAEADDREESTGTDSSGDEESYDFDPSLLLPDGEESVLGQSEIDDLFGIGMDEDKETTGIEALVNGRVTRHQRMPLLEACFERLVRTLTESLRKFTSESIELSLTETTSIRFGDYLEAMPLPAMISVFKAVEWDDYGLVTINSPLIYAVIDVLLGGRRISTSPAIEGRSFTKIESMLIQRMIVLILEELSIAVEPLSKVQFCHERLESNPSLAAIAHPASTAILVKIDVDMDDRGGRIEILIPYATLEPIQHVIQQMFMGEKFGRDTVWGTHWANELLLIDGELEVSLGEQMIAVSDLMNLKVGSTLQLRTRPNDLVTLRFGQVPLLRGKIGRLGDKMAIQIDDWVRGRQSTQEST